MSLAIIAPYMEDSKCRAARRHSCSKGTADCGGHSPAVVESGMRAEQELLPYRGTEFDVQGQTGISLRFLVEESGAVRSSP